MDFSLLITASWKGSALDSSLSWIRCTKRCFAQAVYSQPLNVYETASAKIFMPSQESIIRQIQRPCAWRFETQDIKTQPQFNH